MKEKILTYRDAGVDIDKGNALVERIKLLTRQFTHKGSLNTIGGFGALFELPLEQYKNPVLVSSTDGVGTKLKLAIALNKHDTIGIDLVAMSVNDIITLGAKPLFFLDYYATGQLDVDTAEQVIKGIVQGCALSDAVLSGGETAEMPDMYAIGEYDLAGFCVGIVEKNSIIDGKKVAVGDSMIGIASSGIHSNGYSLVRKIIAHSQVLLTSDFQGKTLGEVLLEPTRIYVKALLQLIDSVPVHALAHITGGGLLENLPRVLPQGVCAEINTQSWKRPAIFQWLQEQGNVAESEMYRTFNCGIGMVVCVPRESLELALNSLKNSGETAWHIGQIVENPNHSIRFISSD